MISNHLCLVPCFSFAMLCGCVSTPVSDQNYLPVHQKGSAWFKGGQLAIARKEAELPLVYRGQAKNVILFVGDGMGVSTVTAARILAGQLQGALGEEHVLSFESFPFVGLSKTYNVDQQTPDSAGTVTALMTGVKTDAGVVNLAEQVELGDCQSGVGLELLTALELAELSGKATGVVTTARITHATPAGAYARSAHRNWENDAVMVGNGQNSAGCEDIASQLINYERGLKSRFPSVDSSMEINGIDVVLGGGWQHFLPIAQGGRREDGRNLINEWQQQYPGGRYVTSASELAAVQDDEEPLLGLFSASHMSYDQERLVKNTDEPTLVDMTAQAIKRLQKDDDGFFLMVEAGRIDHAHHANSAFNALHETLALSASVERALSMVDLEETLIIVTADHSHVFTMAGYPKRGNPILGKVVKVQGNELALDEAGRPYTTLGYMNGLGMQHLGDETDADHIYQYAPNAGRKDLTKLKTTQPGYHQEVLVPLRSETHGGEDVAIYAIGPGAHLVSGVNEQNVIFHIMAAAANLLTVKH